MCTTTQQIANTRQGPEGMQCESSTLPHFHLSPYPLPFQAVFPPSCHYVST